jgi:hypothetical protein
MKTIFGFYGASGFGQQIMAFFKIHPPVISSGEVEYLYVDDNFNEPFIGNEKVISYTEFLSYKNCNKLLNITIANSKIREDLVKKAKADGLIFFNIFSKNSLQLSDLSNINGLILSPFSIISSNVKLGEFCHIGFHSSISHDCRIGNYVTVATGVRCNGNVHIEDHTYIGSGALIKQGTPDQPLIIGKGAIVGMGAVVTKSVPAGVTVVGNPARILEKK